MSPAAHAATLPVRRSSRFVAWVRAWRAGLVPYDDVAAEIAGDEEHLVADVPGTWTDVPLGEGVAALSKLHPDEVRLVMPAPGDPRGLPGPGPFTGAALVTGEGVLASRLGLVPEVRTHTSGSGVTFETVLWRCFPLPEACHSADEPTAAEAEAELSTALTEALKQPCTWCALPCTSLAMQPPTVTYLVPGVIVGNQPRGAKSAMIWARLTPASQVSVPVASSNAR